MFKLIFTESYQRKAKKLISAHPGIIKQYDKILKLLCINPWHPSLRIHKLSGRLSGIYSISINISYRMTIHFIISKKQIIPIDIGSHNEVY